MLGERRPSGETLRRVDDLSSEEAITLIQEGDVDTVYLPLDGTRRFLRMHAKPGMSEAELIDLYYYLIEHHLPKIIRIFHKYGVKNLIVLAMDRTGFDRGQTYTKTAIERGYMPLFDSGSEYGKLYKDLDARVVFAGFNEAYAEYGFGELLADFEDLENKTAKNKGFNLLWYTSYLPDEDYLAVGNAYAQLREENSDITLEDAKLILIERLYRVPLQKIDVSFFYGFPRSKVLPPLINNQTVFLYTRKPTLTLDDTTIRRGLLLTALTKKAIYDSYPQYFSEAKQSTVAEKGNGFWAEESYHFPDYYI